MIRGFLQGYKKSCRGTVLVGQKSVTLYSGYGEFHILLEAFRKLISVPSLGKQAITLAP